MSCRAVSDLTPLILPFLGTRTESESGDRIYDTSETNSNLRWRIKGQMRPRLLLSVTRCAPLQLLRSSPLRTRIFMLKLPTQSSSNAATDQALSRSAAPFATPRARRSLAICAGLAWPPCCKSHTCLLRKSPRPSCNQTVSHSLSSFGSLNRCNVLKLSVA